LQLFLCCFNEISRVCLSKYYLDDHHQSQHTRREMAAQNTRIKILKY
jgi:hypothetical protein